MKPETLPYRRIHIYVHKSKVKIRGKIKELFSLFGQHNILVLHLLNSPILKFNF